MARQEAQILQQMMNTPGLKPRLTGISHLDRQGNQVYDTGDIISPGNGAVIQIGSQLSQALNDLPGNRTFQRKAERGAFEGTPLGEITMLGSTAPGKNQRLGQAVPDGPDIGMAMNRLRRTMEKEKDSKMQGDDYDERGRRKTFQMLGTGAFGMPAPEGPLSADRMPYQDVLQTAGVTPDALMKLPGVLAASGSSESNAANKAKADNSEKQAEQAEKQQQLMTMLGVISQMAGDRSFSYDPDGKISLGEAPKTTADKPQPGLMQQLLNPSKQDLTQAGQRMAGSNLSNAVGNPLQRMLGAAGGVGMPVPTIGGQQQQPQQNQQGLMPIATPSPTGVTSTGGMEQQQGAPGLNSLPPQVQSMVQQYQQMYPTKSPQEILQAMQARGLL